MLEIICMPMIVALVYALIELYKKAISGAKHAIFAKLIPIIACVLGVMAGTICYYCFPELIAAHNLATAMLIGAASGLSATGCNQIFKQLKQYGIDVKQPNQESTTSQENFLKESTFQESEKTKSKLTQENVQSSTDVQNATDLQNRIDCKVQNSKVQNKDENQ